MVSFAAILPRNVTLAPPHDEVVHLPAAERGFMRQLSLDEAIPQCIERPQVADSTPTRPSASPLPRTTTEFLFPIADVVR